MRTLHTMTLMLLMACGGDATDTDAGDAPELTWDEMSFDERSAFMATDVMPAMAPIFEAYDSTRFAGFGCDTCHGTDPAFVMPASLPLDVEAFPLTEDPDPLVAADALFMEEEVTPLMVELLGVEPFDPVTFQGFGCFGCHAFAQ